MVPFHAALEEMRAGGAAINNKPGLVVSKLGTIPFTQVDVGSARCKRSIRASGLGSEERH